MSPGRKLTPEEAKEHGEAMRRLHEHQQKLNQAYKRGEITWEELERRLSERGDES